MSARPVVTRTTDRERIRRITADFTMACSENVRLRAENAELVAACQLAAMSSHHPRCKCRAAKYDITNRCDCHVGKARAALAKAGGGA